MMIRNTVTIAALLCIFILGIVNASEVSTKTVIVDDLPSVVQGDWFGTHDLKFEAPGFLVVSLSSAAVANHTTTLCMSPIVSRSQHLQ
jgi:hypothetical protein